ncbi:MAG: putative protoheme IX biogenesis protein [Candidatus Accumulibacter appositus]|uniref:Putative protoheme IX biogenesis protein n=1 Tax=Candidatus Accumulibacter appositus TaxID=1454003 RepID=A0A011NA66_9PROT|nr:heme biosynthesis HemY N-terminal domain-containing protein [Accumulibacter sp.]EXI79523.1 MAG: putative protoheme IX biogenesis protein [Candidatus Accumulibacter appositus]HRF04887.1 heme biosynthesis HemY N-terminal domain-containing protein [Accumulibacter sp.]
MRGLLWLLALVAMAVGVSLAARYNDGYLLLIVPPYRIEIALSLAIILFIAAFMLLSLVLRTIGLTLSLPRRFGDYRARRRSEKATASLHEAIRLLFEGRFTQALKKAGEAHTAGQDPGLAALLAARAAHGLREPEKEQEWLGRVSDPRLDPARLMLEAEIAIDHEQYGEAVSVLHALQNISGRHIAALRLELRAQQGCGNWPEVLKLARVLEKREALAPELVQEIKTLAHQETIRQQQEDEGQLLTYLRAIPAKERSLRLTHTSCQALLEHGVDDEAQRMIEKQLDAQWDSDLVQLYGQVRSSDLTSCIARAEKWLPRHPDDAQLLLALGRLCLQQRLWGKAQIYLEASLSLLDQRAVRLELARLFEQTERWDEAMPHYRAAAEQIALRVATPPALLRLGVNSLPQPSVPRLPG